MNCKSYLSALCILGSLISPMFGQFADDFSDTDLGNRWSGEVSKFRVSGAGELQLNAPLAGSAYIVRPFIKPDSIVWDMYFRMEFDPSGSNRLRIWLLSDSEELDTGNGFYLEIGESGNTDAIRLFSKTGATRTQLANGTIGAVALANVIARIRVSLDSESIWRLSADYSGGQILSQEFQVASPGLTLPEEVYFGFYCQFTDTRRDLFFFDDIRVDRLEPDTIPPVIRDFQLVTDRRIRINFNEALSDNWIADVVLQPGNHLPEVSFVQGSLSDIHLDFDDPFISQTDYTLTVGGISDAAGNTMNDTSLFFTYYLFESPEPYDVIFSELMVRETPARGLPPQEYIELYNRSQKVINTSDIFIRDGNNVRGFQNTVLLPGEFVIVCAVAHVPLFQSYGKTVGMPVFPGLTNSGKRLLLEDAAGNLIDHVEYNEDWYQDRIKRNGGYSLELINPDAPCRMMENWRGSDDLRGGTPGQINSVWSRSEDVRQPVVLDAYPLDEKTVLLTFDKKLEEQTAGDAASYQLVPEIGITAALWDKTNPFQSTLILQEAMTVRTVYQVLPIDVADCLQIVHAPGISTKVGFPEPPEPLDLVVNEVLFQPEVGGSRFVEIYNRSDKVLDVFPLFIADFGGSTPDGFRTEVQKLIFPGEHMAFSADPVYIRDRYMPPDYVTIQNARIPTLSDREGNVTIYTFVDGDPVIVDGLDYSRDFHYALLSDRRGISIERIDPEQPTNDRNNWHSAAENVGYGTPGYLNSQNRNRTTESSDRIFFEDKFFSPDGDGHKDFLQINYELDTPGFNANVKIFDSEGRLVRDLVKGELLPSSGSFKWDGTDDQGRPCRMGIYIVLAEFVEPQGTVIRFKEDCVLGGVF